ncbi:MAG TPA: hypothetical protein VKA49_09260, partial [Flavitalea sp.]|nr:hypothetical protein [Flavitalea sp.]
LSVSGTITETGTGLPMIELDGSIAQNISVTGAITGSVAIKLNNAAGITLQTPMAVSYKLELVRGNIRTTAANVLIMHDNTSCAGSSVNSFVEGPIRKLGDDDFQFPIGKQGIYAPASISGTGGNTNDEFEAEYFLGSPATIFGTAIENPPIVRISALEYWKVDRVVGTSTKKITLSVGTYSDATLLEKLLVTRWDMPGNIWKDEGNSAYSGIATGTITSNDLQSLGVFTIASTVQNQNPLPVVPISFNATSRDKHAALKWRVAPALEIQRFEILRSDDRIHFRLIETIPALSVKAEYEFVETLSTPGTYYYKIMMTEKNGNVHQSSIRSIVSSENGIQLQVATAVTNHILNLTLNAPERTMVNIIVLNAEGKTLRKISTQLYSRSQNLAIDLSAIPVGVHYITAVANGIKTNVVRFVKLQ